MGKYDTPPTASAKKPASNFSTLTTRPGQKCKRPVLADRPCTNSHGGGGI